MLLAGIRPGRKGLELVGAAAPACLTGIWPGQQAELCLPAEGFRRGRCFCSLKSCGRLLVQAAAYGVQACALGAVLKAIDCGRPCRMQPDCRLAECRPAAGGHACAEGLPNAVDCRRPRRMQSGLAECSPAAGGFVHVGRLDECRSTAGGIAECSPAAGTFLQEALLDVIDCRGLR